MNTSDLFLFKQNTLLDINGNNCTKQLPANVIRKYKNSDTPVALKKTHTKTGKIQWRLVNVELYNKYKKETFPLKSNHNTSLNDIVKFINQSIELKPDELVISNLKWRYLIRSVLRGKNIMMTGPSGCGKTFTVQTVAKVLNERPYFYFNFGATTDARSALIGNTHFDKERGTFVSNALFVEAIQKPNAIILMDELTRGSHDAWNILITVLDETQRYLRVDEHPDTPTIKVAPGVTFIATANVGSEYTSTRVLDRAIIDRFPVVIEMEPLQEAEEATLLAQKFPSVDDEMIHIITKIAAATRANVKLEDAKISTIISTRSTVEMASLLSDGFTLEEVAEMCIFPLYSDVGGLDSERTFMRQLVQKFVPSKSSDATLNNLYSVNAVNA